MKFRHLVYLTVVLSFLLSPLNLGFAQDTQPPGEEPGVLPGGALLSPGDSELGETSNGVSSFPEIPIYDSGWVALAPDEAKTLTHNLGRDPINLIVDMQYWSSGVDGINQRYYGGADFGTLPAPGHAPDDRVGAYWRSLTSTSIVVYRRPEDTYAEKVRIRIWWDDIPNWDSGWVAISPEVVMTLNHNLGGNADDYVVNIQYRTSDVNGINHRYYGGMDYGAYGGPGHNPDDRVGTYWRTLTNTSITLFRRAEDDYSPNVRVRIWVNPKPTYDSGWVSINQDQAITLLHNIGGNAEDYIVDMQYKSTVSGVNQRYYGGADFGAYVSGIGSENDRVGAYWRSLTNSSIVIYRRPEDTFAEQMRIRIWHHWTPTPASYDSGWLSLSTNTSLELFHNLGGNVDDYYVSMWFRASPPSIDGINLRYYGGVDFGVNPPAGTAENDRVGVYWRNLTNNSITLYRRSEDIYASEVRLRIWVMPKPDYDSGWVALPVNSSTIFSHQLGGQATDYLVDLEYKNTLDVINQRYYGGMDAGTNPSYGMSENDRTGVYWRSLTNSSITVYRRPEDVFAQQVRIRIWRIMRADYISGWIYTTPDVAQTLTHNLGGSADSYLLTMDYWDTDIANTYNQRYWGGADFGTLPPAGYAIDDRVGAYWRSLTSSEITFYRRPEDGFADYVLIRIWKLSSQVYLPLMVRSDQR